MRQVRMCWDDKLSRVKRDLSSSSEWADATPELSHYYELIAQAGNEVFGPGTHWIETREAQPDRPSPDAEVKALVQNSMQAWLEGDMPGHLGYFTSAAAFVSPDGECHRGHGALSRAFAQERAAMPGLVMEPRSIEIAHPVRDAAVVMMRGVLMHAGLQEPQNWAATLVAVWTEEGRWRIASMQVLHIR